RRQFGCLTLVQAGDMKEDVLATAVRAQKAEALLFEVCHHGTGLRIGGPFFGRIPTRGGRLLGTTRLVPDSLFQQSHVFVRQLARWLTSLRGHFQIGILPESFFEKAFLSGVQTSNPRLIKLLYSFSNLRRNLGGSRGCDLRLA